MGLRSLFARKKKPGPNRKVVSTMKNIIKFTSGNKTKLKKYSTNNLLYAITAVSGPRNNYNMNNKGVWYVVQSQKNLTKNALLNNLALMGPNIFKGNLPNYQKNQWNRYNYYLKHYFPNRKR